MGLLYKSSISALTDKLKEAINCYQSKKPLWREVLDPITVQLIPLTEITVEQKDKLRSSLSEAKTLYEEMKSYSNSLAEEKKAWLSYLQTEFNFNPALQAQEFQEYSQFAGAADGFVVTLSQAQSSLELLKANVDLMGDVMQQILKANQSSSSSGGSTASGDEEKIRKNSGPENPESPTTIHSPKIFRLPESMVNSLAPPAAVGPQPIPVPVVQNSQPVVPVLDVDLPKFELPKYDGDPAMWSSFWDLYNDSVHKRLNVSNALKFRLLKGALVGKAARSIAALPPTNENYPEAIQTLQSRFGDPEMVKQHLWDKLHKLSYSKSQNLSETVDTIEETVRQLNALHEDTSHPYFAQMIQQILPPSVNIELENMRHPGVPWQMNALLQSLRWIIQKRERVSQFERMSPGKQQPSMPSKPPWEQSATGGRSGVMFPYHSNKNPPTVPCAFCHESGHWNEDCLNYPLRSRGKRAATLGLCSLCLKSGHTRMSCQTTKPCIHCGKNDHNRALCFSLSQKKADGKFPGKKFPTKTESSHGDAQQQPTVVTTSEEIQPEKTDGNCATCMETPMMMDGTFCMAHVHVRNPHEPTKLLEAQLFMDSGSKRSFIQSDLAAKLNLKATPNDFSLGRFACSNREYVKSSLVTFEIICRDGSTESIMANTLPVLTMSMDRPALSKDDLQYLKQIPTDFLAEKVSESVTSDRPSIILGVNYFWDMLTTEKKKKLPSGLYMVPSKFGLLITGASEVNGPPESFQTSDGNLCSVMVENLVNQSIPVLNLHTEPDEYVKRSLLPNLEDFWSLEAIGVTDNPEVNDADMALKQFNSKVKINSEGRIEVGLPWRKEPPDLPDNYGLAFGQLKSQMRKYRENPDLLQKVNTIMEEQLASGKIEIVSPEKSTKGPVSYLPHHPVVTPLKETTKVREVFNGSAKTRKEFNSINDCLYPGPVILPDLVGMIFRCRFHPIILTCDIEKAFLQISIREEDRNALRFLWLKDVTIPQVEGNLCIFRFTRVPFGLNCSPFLLGGSVILLLQSSQSTVAQKLKRNVYVDNGIIGITSPEEGKAMYDEVKQLFDTVHMNMREFMSNSNQLMEMIPANDKAKGPSSKILGIPWDTLTDEIGVVPPKETSSGRIDTKRSVLQIIASVFDPMGLIAPIMLPCKLFIQTLWQNDQKWDEPLTEDQIQKWLILKQELMKLGQVKIPRYLGTNVQLGVPLELHVFTDASSKAYGFAAYVVVPGQHSHLVFAKTRLAPVKRTLTLPRLELMGLLLGVRAARFLQTEADVKFTNVTIWSDSQCCLHWVNSVKPLSIFVENRIKEIKSVPNLQFTFVPGETNPADYSSRGTTTSFLATNPLWWEGPTWLKFEKSQWPKWNGSLSSEVEKLLTDELNRKTRRSKPPDVDVSLTSIPVRNTLTSYSDVIDISRFSSLRKLERVTALCFRFLKNLMHKVHKEPTDHLLKNIFTTIPSSEQISAKELESVRVWWIYHIQRKSFSHTFEAIQLGKRDHLRDQLGLVMNADGLLECHGRVQQSVLPNAACFPVLLPSNDYYTQLLIMQEHCDNKHVATAHTLSILRLTYWIPKGRSTVKRILNSCYVCKKVRATPFERPPMPCLPSERICPERPFKNIGVDYFGPLLAKQGKEVVKFWVAIFVCMVSRAIHLEIVSDKSTEQFLGSFRKFVGRRGYPDKIITDHATQFQAAKSLLEKVPVDSAEKEVYDYCSNHKIQWQMIPEFAPWAGGFYERLIAIVKDALKKCLRRKILSLDEMEVFIVEIEGIVNSRPLTFLHSELESRAILRPIDFLIPTAMVGIPELKSIEDPKDPTYLEKTSTKDKVLQLWSKLQTNLDKFWKFFSQEYIPSLREIQKLKHADPRLKTARAPILNELVIVKDPLIPRGQWKIGRVLELLKGSDGKVRVVKLQLPNKREINRPVNLLYPLELSSREMEENSVDDKPQTDPTPQQKYNLRPRKKVNYKETNSEEDE